MHPVLMHYLFQQGLENSHDIFSFLSPTTNDFYDPFLMKDMKTAVNRIVEAIKKNEEILIFGDYDADGITATALLFKCLKSFGAHVKYKVPTRREGYGLKVSTVQKLPDKIALIITVDNGTTCQNALTQAKKRGIDVIVTDHHEVSEGIPSCLAFINPKRCDNTYPYPYLSGAGVAFKLAHALYLANNKNWDIHYQEYVELAAIGIIADLVPLNGENRTICKLALEKMNTIPLEVLKAFFTLLKINKVGSSTISNQIAPLLNSQGKLGDPNISVNLLTSAHFHMDNLIEHIELNKKRKLTTDLQYTLCEKNILENKLFEEPVITIHGTYSKGSMGSLASKISKKYRKPVVIVGRNGFGSGRSVCSSKFSLLNTLKRCKEHLIKFGGHHCSVGFYIEPSELKIKTLFADIQHAVKKEGSFSSVKWYFTEQSPIEFRKGIFDNLLLLEPFGKGFSQPIFLSPALNIEEMKMFGENSEHAMIITDTNEKFYLYNKAPMIGNYKSQTRSLFYTSTLNNENEFFVHAIQK
ncbi:DHH family phosphoesterase [Bacillus cereus group sp. BfR-BA-01451]|nr:DHH family phosphoesterase [Bacillus cereus group sp. BfR-BA-01451]